MGIDMNWEFLIQVGILGCLVMVVFKMESIHETLEQTRIQMLGVSEDIQKEIRDTKFN